MIKKEKQTDRQVDRQTDRQREETEKKRRKDKKGMMIKNFSIDLLSVFFPLLSMMILYTRYEYIHIQEHIMLM